MGPILPAMLHGSFRNSHNKSHIGDVPVLPLDTILALPRPPRIIGE
jgi:hypothetical protein